MVKGAHKRDLQNTESHNKAACERKEKKESKRVIEVFYKTQHRFVPKLSKWIALIEDPRQKNKIKYNIEHLLWIGIFLFLMKLGSRRQINFQFQTEEFKENLNLLSKGKAVRVADHGTLENLLKQLPVEFLCWLKQQIIKRLIRMRALEKYRLFEKYYLISVDGTGYLNFGKRRHCPNCLTRKTHGETHYYHNILEAKIVTENGFAFSVETERIENVRGDKKTFKRWRQDCELKAFYRLAPRLKKKFPQLKICLVLDALYANGEVFQLCDKYGWKYIITFKEGSMPDMFRWWERMKEIGSVEKAQIIRGKNTQKFAWINDLPYIRPPFKEVTAKLNILEYRETEKDIAKKFVWITNFNINENTFEKIAKSGRMRWKIENEGFNTQKNGGYNLEHSYSHNEVASSNYYQLLQIAHIFAQLMEKGSLLKKQIQKNFGSLRNIAKQLLEDFRTKIFTQQALQSCLATPFQIRFSLPP